MFAIQYKKKYGVRAVAKAMLPPPPTKFIALPGQRGLIGEEKGQCKLSHVLKGEE